MQHLEDLTAALRQEGLRITPQRVAILEYLLKTVDHRSAEYVHNVVKKKHPMVSLSTVYKTLDLLKEKKLINEIEVDGEARFDANTEPHINLVCLNCGKIDDLDEESLNEIQSRAAKKSKYQVLRGSFELFGYCNDCKVNFS